MGFKQHCWCFCERHILAEYNGKTGTGWRSLIITVVEPAGAPYTGDMNTNISNDNTDTSNDDTNTSYDLLKLTEIIITVVQFVVSKAAADMNTDNH